MYFTSSMLSYRSVDIRKALQLEELLAREEFEYIIEEEVAKQTIRTWLEGCLKKIRANNARQPNSLIAGLRATNDIILRNELEEKIKEAAEAKADSKEAENRKKAQTALSRSDSTESSSGRKFLQPTLSDPQARNEKDRFNASKKNKQRHQPNPKQTKLPHLDHPSHGHHTVEQILNNKLMLQSNNSHQTNQIFEVHDWWQEQVICGQSSDEE